MSESWCYWESRWRDQVNVNHDLRGEIERLTRWNRALQRRLQDRADEIKRLREALERIIELSDWPMIIEIAESVLEQARKG